MIDAIINAISIVLNAEFDDKPNLTVFKEEIRQGLEEPCFFIQCLNPTHNLYLGRRYYRQNQFCIQYFPASEDYEEECNNVAERLMWCLEYITCIGDEKAIRGTQMHCEIVDGVLNFFINYDCFVFKVVELEKMQELKSDTKVRDGE